MKNRPRMSDFFKKNISLKTVETSRKDPKGQERSIKKTTKHISLTEGVKRPPQDSIMLRFKCGLALITVVSITALILI